MINVDEQGTEAAAATAVMMVAGAAPNPDKPKEFNADRPFSISYGITKQV
jgi:serine protease inhibitor